MPGMQKSTFSALFDLMVKSGGSTISGVYHTLASAMVLLIPVASKQEVNAVSQDNVDDEQQFAVADINLMLEKSKNNLLSLLDGDDLAEAKTADDPSVIYAKHCMRLITDLQQIVDSPPEELTNMQEFVDDALTILYLQYNDKIEVVDFINEEDYESVDPDRKKNRMGLYRYMFQIERDGAVPIETIKDVFKISRNLYVNPVPRVFAKNAVYGASNNLDIHLSTYRNLKESFAKGLLTGLKKKLLFNITRLAGNVVGADSGNVNGLLILDKYIINKGMFSLPRNHIPEAKLLKQLLQSDVVTACKLHAIRLLEKLYLTGNNTADNKLPSEVFNILVSNSNDNNDGMSNIETGDLFKKFMASGKYFKTTDIVRRTTDFFSVLQKLESHYKKQCLDEDKATEWQAAQKDLNDHSRAPPQTNSNNPM